ncbi:squalene/phytoene synthase family protein [Micromonospora sp. NPDC048930]|uniref:squalene/phytoene synthase family protein n=1 Tax=Micromonospora sp. NPDC048930 TaxID=3364261 RepID=UPI0037200EDF
MGLYESLASIRKTGRAAATTLTTWPTALDAAGIHEEGQRSDYSRSAQFIRDRDTVPYLGVRVLAPPAMQPHLLAGLAFANRTDDLADAGNSELARARLADWLAQSRRGVSDDSCPYPIVRAFVNSVTVRGLDPSWMRTFLDAAEQEPDFAGFADEADFGQYVDRYTWPLLMCSAGLQYQGGPSDEAARIWRAYAEFAQRLDILNDLRADLTDGRLCLPADALTLHSVDRADLEQGRDTRNVRALLQDMCTRTRTVLKEARTVLEVCDPGQLIATRLLLLLQERQLEDINRSGPRILRRPVGFHPPTMVRAMLGTLRT